MSSSFASLDEVPATLHTASDLYTQGRRPVPGAEPAATVKVSRARVPLYTRDQTRPRPGLDQDTLDQLKGLLHCPHCSHIHRNRHGKALLPEYAASSCQAASTR